MKKLVLIQWKERVKRKMKSTSWPILHYKHVLFCVYHLFEIEY